MGSYERRSKKDSILYGALLTVFEQSCIVDSRYLKVQVTMTLTLRYQYFEIKLKYKEYTENSFDLPDILLYQDLG